MTNVSQRPNLTHDGLRNLRALQEESNGAKFKVFNFNLVALRVTQVFSTKKWTYSGEE